MRPRYDRLSRLAREDAKKRQRATDQRRAEQIAKTLTPRIVEREYPVTVEQNRFGPYGLESIIELNAKPRSRYLEVYSSDPVQAMIDYERRAMRVEVSRFHFTVEEYQMQHHNMRVRWWGWTPSEDFPRAVVYKHMYESYRAAQDAMSAIADRHRLGTYHKALDKVLVLVDTVIREVDALTAETRETYIAGKRQAR